jgi:glutathione S-transferase
MGHGSPQVTIVPAVQRLYHREGAGRPPRVRWALEEASAPYDFVVMDSETGRSEEHARRHPLVRVPVLETDEGTLFESAALCLHIADLHPDTGLIPAPGSHERATVYQWSFFAMTELEPAMIRMILARRGADAEEIAKAEARLAKAAQVIADVLDGRGYVAGDDFTIADVVVGGVLDSARHYDVMPDSPMLRSYLERLDARPAKQRAYDVVTA